jgi:hypothetical protein
VKIAKKLSVLCSSCHKCPHLFTPGEGPCCQGKIIPYETLDMKFVFHMKVLKDRKKNPKKKFSKKKKPCQPPIKIIYYQNI